MPTGPPVALIGCGRWGSHVLRDLLSLGCSVFVVARSGPSRKRAGEGGATSIVHDLGELPRVEGAVVVTNSTSHAAVVEDLLSLQIPIFVEKPMTVDVQSAKRLASLAGERVFVMHKWRYHPGIRAIREIAKSDELGPVVGLRTERVGWSSVDRDEDPVWYLAPHDLSICLEILGGIPKPQSAVVDRVADRPVGMLAILGFNPWFAFEISARNREWRRQVTLICEKGRATLPDSYSRFIEVLRSSELMLEKEPESEHIPISAEMPLLRELATFVRHLQGGPPPDSSASDGVKVIETIAELRQLAGILD